MPYIQKEISGTEVTIGRMNQFFVENIAMPAIMRWERAMKNIGECLPLSFSIEVIQTYIPAGTPLDYPCVPNGDAVYSHSAPPPLMPPCIPPTSALCIIPGRPQGAIEPAIRKLHPEQTLMPTAADYKSLEDACQEYRRLYDAQRAAGEEMRATIEKLQNTLAEKEHALEQVLVELAIVKAENAVAVPSLARLAEDPVAVSMKYCR